MRRGQNCAPRKNRGVVVGLEVSFSKLLVRHKWIASSYSDRTYEVKDTLDQPARGTNAPHTEGLARLFFVRGGGLEDDKGVAVSDIESVCEGVKVCGLGGVWLSVRVTARKRW